MANAIIDGIEICEQNRSTLYAPNRQHEKYHELIKRLDWYNSRGVVAVLAFSQGVGWAVYRNGLIQVTRERNRGKV